MRLIFCEKEDAERNLQEIKDILEKEEVLWREQIRPYIFEAKKYREGWLKDKAKTFIIYKEFGHYVLDLGHPNYIKYN